MKTSITRTKNPTIRRTATIGIRSAKNSTDSFEETNTKEIRRLVRETGCLFCLDFAHILAREKKDDYEKRKSLFPEKEWHAHFSGIIHGDKGERSHRKTKKQEWRELLKNLPKDKDIVIINEAPNPPEDSKEGLEIYRGL